MITLKEAVIVEGRYDKVRLQTVVDALIIETRGFHLFKDEKKKAYIKKLAAERGILILTDSDSAGFLIRNHLKSFVPEAQIKNAYIPKVTGKEKRKKAPSGEGLLGVEGISAAALEEAIRKAGAGLRELPEAKFTQTDLYNLGLTGREGSRENRLLFLNSLGLPDYLSTKDLLKYMNLNAEAVIQKLNEGV